MVSPFGLLLVKLEHKQEPAHPLSGNRVNTATFGIRRPTMEDPGVLPRHHCEGATVRGHPDGFADGPIGLEGHKMSFSVDAPLDRPSGTIRS